MNDQEYGKTPDRPEADDSIQTAPPQPEATEAKPAEQAAHDAGAQYAPPSYGGGYYNPGNAPWPANHPGYQGGGQWQGPQNQWTGGQYSSWQRPAAYTPAGYQWSPGGPGSFPPPPPGEQDGKKKKKKGRGFVKAVCALLALAIVSFSVYGIYVAATGENPLAARPEQSAGGSGGNAIPDVTLNTKPQGPGDYDATGVLSPAQIYAKVSPSVVGVVSYLGQGVYGYMQQGSGIIMTADGYIITNAHVVEGATRVEIVLVDGASYDAVIVGLDTRSDLAILKTQDAANLIPAEFGDSDELIVGERVCAIGNPSGLALQSSLTVGYVSALNRSVSTSDSAYNLECIQTDAAINPGNSGGALINEYGQVIGINSIKVIDVDYEGIGFAIPITDAMPILKDLIANGKVTGRPMLGITSVPVTAAEAQAYGIPLGLWVKGFTEGADIAKQGVRVDDIITQVDDTPVYSINDCAEILKDFAPGDTITVTVYRTEGAVRNNTFKVDIILMAS